MHQGAGNDGSTPWCRVKDSSKDYLSDIHPTSRKGILPCCQKQDCREHRLAELAIFVVIITAGFEPSMPAWGWGMRATLWSTQLLAKN